MAGFQLGDHEHVFNDVHEPLAVLVHDADEFAGQGRSFLHELVFHQVFQVSHNDGERRAQFVGGVGHEVPPHLVGEVVLRDVAQQDALFPDGGIRDGAVQMPCRDAVLHSAGGVDGAEGEFLGDGTVRVKGFLHVEQKFLIAHQGTDFAAFQAFFLKEFARQRIGQHDVSGRAMSRKASPSASRKRRLSAMACSWASSPRFNRRWASLRAFFLAFMADRHVCTRCQFRYREASSRRMRM